jgi:hypothetical protein
VFFASSVLAFLLNYTIFLCSTVNSPLVTSITGQVSLCSPLFLPSSAHRLSAEEYTTNAGGARNVRRRHAHRAALDRPRHLFRSVCILRPHKGTHAQKAHEALLFVVLSDEFPQYQQQMASKKSEDDSSKDGAKPRQ